MAVENQDDIQTDTTNQANDNGELDTTTNDVEIDKLPDKQKAYIDKLRNENKTRRLENKTLLEKAARLDELEKQLNETKTKEMQEAGKYKELYDTAENENKELKLKVKEYDTAITMLDGIANDKLKTLPANIQALLPEKLSIVDKFAWIEKALKASGTQDAKATANKPNPDKKSTNGNADKDEQSKATAYALKSKSGYTL